jgi:RNA polymerase sigma-70 factor, ECF subfamily
MDSIAGTPALSVEALKRGDPIEIARMVEVYSPLIYRLGLKMLSNEQDAEDILQETFLKALRGISGFEDRSNLSTWLYRIGMNEALMMLRKRKNAPAELIDQKDAQDEVESPVEIVDWGKLPEEELLDGEGRLFLDRAVDLLTENLKTVFVLRDVEGLSVKETADVLKVSEAVVKTRLLRARLKLREILSGYYRERMVE